jgi:putative transposase
MKTVTTTPELLHSTTENNSHLFDDWFDPIETGIRDRARELIEEMIRSELDAVLSRPRYGRRAGPVEGSDATAVVTGHRHGSRVRTLTGTFGKTEIAVPRARLNGSDGKTTEWKSQALRNYQRRTRTADALIAGVYLAGTNTRRVDVLYFRPRAVSMDLPIAVGDLLGHEDDAGLFHVGNMRLSESDR